MYLSLLLMKDALWRLEIDLKEKTSIFRTVIPRLLKQNMNLVYEFAIRLMLLFLHAPFDMTITMRNQVVFPFLVSMI